MKFSIKACRVNCGLSAETVADFCGIHVQTLRRYERDSSLMPCQMLETMSYLFQVEKDRIFLGPEAELVLTINAIRGESVL
ncbi:MULTISPECIES: helix-turn-helix domain-containing protein [Aerococcus]|uniref:Helix-turn-helix transcriptional regulator n=1 Tax=Aerococcus sanguinicola TaxID=119206 RepID=A0A5N1GKE6_9LACT|nr:MULTISPECIES: helix-turn-helix transcriptional regulator [Aerococcus]KAA9300768.1 helix-turn-helix transcriptional regulator [Aerococcus sanguinicola]MDK6369447.1 helix-turn-helix transcriptional regulator [Aerococcus sp. UMB9870]MDK6680510.1 helix-turn-helix transcriptional regulator [Aerococcus sp. UMB8608]MDK6686690.1 helix-turn-helix transcriptional regulator [Aerococcus sp. UMB8623]MDK6940457.1 helix-turn-helix transcriptional regulator [Aerococcus sp. UMB8487]